MDFEKAVGRLTGPELGTTGTRPRLFTVTDVTDAAIQIVIQSTGKWRRITIREVEDGTRLAQRDRSVRPIDLRQADVSEANPAYVASLVQELLKVLRIPNCPQCGDNDHVVRDGDAASSHGLRDAWRCLNHAVPISFRT